jgi:hypothetical protein
LDADAVCEQIDYSAVKNQESSTSIFLKWHQNFFPKCNKNQVYTSIKVTRHKWTWKTLSTEYNAKKKQL